MRKPFAFTAAMFLAVSGAALAQGQPTAKPAAPAQPQAQGQQTAQPAPAQNQGKKPEALQDRASYIIGLNLGKSLKAQEIPITLDLIVQGLRDGVAGSSPLLTEEEIQAAMQSFQQEIMAKQEAQMKVTSDKNKQASDAFLAENKKKQGVTTTASGLQYEVITPGSGESPKATDQVTVHYRGTLTDGTVFDSSYDRGEPATFPVNGVIKGWVEALQLMKPGAKYKLYIPPDLAYGDRGAGGVIGPNQALVFEVELISIGAPKPAAGEQKPSQSQR